MTGKSWTSYDVSVVVRSIKGSDVYPATFDQPAGQWTVNPAPHAYEAAAGELLDALIAAGWHPPNADRVGPVRMRVNGLSDRGITNYAWSGYVDDAIRGAGTFAPGDRILAYDVDTMHLADAVLTERRPNFVSVDIDRSTVRQVDAFDFPIPEHEHANR